MKRKINAIWKGDGADGTGVLTAQSGAFNNMPYSFKTRFKNDDGTLGTNPEELIVAAHAGCFNMKLSFVLNESDYKVLNWFLCASHEIISENKASIELINVHINTLSTISILPGELGKKVRSFTKSYID